MTKEIACFGVGILGEDTCKECLHFFENKEGHEDIIPKDHYDFIDYINCSISKPPYINFKALNENA